MPPTNPHQRLQDAIRAVHGCESRFVASKPVREVFQGEVAWEGIVSQFELIGHPKAKICYAWAYQEGDKTKALAVLELPPVDSPESAVKVAIAAAGSDKTERGR